MYYYLSISVFVENPYNGIIEIFIAIVSVLCSLLTILAAFSVYTKSIAENKLELILSNLSSMTYVLPPQTIPQLNEQALKIENELSDYQYLYEALKEKIDKLKRSNSLCIIILIHIFLFIAISFSLFILSAKDHFLLEILLIALTIFGFIESVILINHLIPHNDNYIKKYPTLESLKAINSTIKTNIPNVLSDLPFNLFANSNYFEIYNISDSNNKPERIYSGIKKNLNANENTMSIARLMLQIDFRLTGVKLRFKAKQKEYDYVLNDDKKSSYNNSSIFMIFPLQFTFEDLEYILITANLSDKHNLLYSKKNPPDNSNILFPILFKELPPIDFKDDDKNFKYIYYQPETS